MKGKKKAFNIIIESYEDNILFGELEKMFKTLEKPYKKEFKIKVVDYILSKEDRIHKTEARRRIINEFSIPKQTLSDWEKSYEKFKNNINVSKKVNVGRKNSLRRIEKEIINWIIHNRKTGYAVSIKSICAFIYTIDSNYKKYNYSILRQKVLRILNRNNMINHKSSFIVQPLPRQGKELISLFLYNIITKRKSLKIDDNKTHLIVNCDETALYYENPDTNAIDILGHKEMIIDIDNNEFKRISIILTICGDGTKLEPLIIFKGENKENNLLINNKKIVVSCQSKGWCDEQVFINWYENIFLIYEKYVAKEKCLLILDKSPSHTNELVLKKFKENNTYYVFIPRGFTKILQPLDRGINVPFTTAFKDRYIFEKFNDDFNNSNKNKKYLDIILENQIRRKNIINLITEIWWEEDIIKKELIFNSFRNAGITLKIDGSEIRNWKLPESIIDTGNIYDEFEDLNEYKKETIESINLSKNK